MRCKVCSQWASGCQLCLKGRLVTRKPSRDLVWRRLLHCVCTAGEGGGTSAGTCHPRRRQTDSRDMSLPSAKRAPGLAYRMAPSDFPDELQSRAASCPPSVAPGLKSDGMSASHESSPGLSLIFCAPSSLFLRPRISARRSLAAAPRPHCSAHCSWPLLHRGRAAAPLAPCRAQSAAGRPFPLPSA